MRTWLGLALLAAVLGVAGYAISRAAAHDDSTPANIDPAVFDTHDGSGLEFGGDRDQHFLETLIHTLDARQ